MGRARVGIERVRGARRASARRWRLPVLAETEDDEGDDDAQWERWEDAAQADAAGDGAVQVVIELE